MKKTFVISMLLLLSISFAFAQAQGNYGVRAGLNLSNFDGDSKADNKIGFHAGFMMEYKVHPLIVVQPELLYTQRGTHHETKVPGTTSKTDDLLHYVELPIFLKASIGTADFKIEPYLGPEFRYLVKGGWKTKAGSSETSGDYDKDDINSFDYGLGLGLDLRINRDILLGARYSMGMAEVFKSKLFKDKNTSIMINLGYIY